MPRLTPNQYRLLFSICAVAVLVLSLLPLSVPQPTTGWDKSNHLLAFGVLALLGVRAWAGRMAAVLAGLMAYGVLIEWLQGMTATRSSDWHDLIADAAGLALGLLVHAALTRVWPSLSAHRNEPRA
ncbi:MULTISPECIES: VanZ family protein [Cupriavidus]|uniref:VanZ family protein n=1 Tax=Cupriavidus sp. RAF20_2 TaxID=3233053 RepID=UPI003F8F9644